MIYGEKDGGNTRGKVFRGSQILFFNTIGLCKTAKRKKGLKAKYALSP